jgi:hypothetical protein
MTRATNRRAPAAQPARADLDAELARIAALSIDALRALWRQTRGSEPPACLTGHLMAHALCFALQEQALGGLPADVARIIRDGGKGTERIRRIKAGAVLVREYQGKRHEVLVVPGGFIWQGNTFDSLSTIAKAITGTSWNGPRFFGLRGKADTFAQADDDSTPSREPAECQLPRRRGPRAAVRGPS